MSNHDIDPLDPDGEYWDPMEQPGYWCCGHCGMYPLAPDAQHDCPDDPLD